MIRRSRRILLLLAVVAVVAVIVKRQAAARRDLTPPQPPAWPPIDGPGKPADAAEPAVAAEPAARPAWVPPVDGQCPPGYPIKANDNSRIFHLPGGRFYARTVPERCYANSDDAVADGYRAAKA